MDHHGTSWNWKLRNECRLIMIDPRHLFYFSLLLSPFLSFFSLFLMMIPICLYCIKRLQNILSQTFICEYFRPSDRRWSSSCTLDISATWLLIWVEIHFSRFTFWNYNVLKSTNQEWEVDQCCSSSQFKMKMKTTVQSWWTQEGW